MTTGDELFIGSQTHSPATISRLLFRPLFPASFSRQRFPPPFPATVSRLFSRHRFPSICIFYNYKRPSMVLKCSLTISSGKMSSSFPDDRRFWSGMSRELLWLAGDFKVDNRIVPWDELISSDTLLTELSHQLYKCNFPLRTSTEIWQELLRLHERWKKHSEGKSESYLQWARKHPLLWVEEEESNEDIFMPSKTGKSFSSSKGKSTAPSKGKSTSSSKGKSNSSSQGQSQVILF